MSDLSQLFEGKMTWAQFIAKEEGNVATEFQKLPAEIQPFVQASAPALDALGTAVAGSAGGALGALIASELPTLETWLANLLTKAGVQAATPAGQAAIATIGNAAIATVNTLTAQASNGITTVLSGVPQPTPGG